MNSLATFFRESRTARFFIPVGIILIAFGILVFIINSNNQNYIEVESTVTKVELYQESYIDANGDRVEALYDLTVKYTVNDVEYESILNALLKHEVGDKIKIYYNPENPNEITQTKSLILPLIIILVGIASLVGGIISAVNAVKRHKKMKEQEKGWTNE